MSRVKHVVSRHYGATQIAIALAGLESYELLRRALRPNWPLALAHAREILSLERLTDLSWEQPLQRAFLGYPVLIDAMNVFYIVGHFLITAVFFCWLYHRSRPAFERFRNGFLTATGIAIVIHWQFPTAPPRLAGVGLVDTLRRFSDINIGSPRSSPFSDPVAAVPSLHAGWALGVGIGLVLYARPLFWKAVGALYPFVVVLTVVVTGNHFVFDTIAGMAVLGLGFGVADLLGRRSVVNFWMRRGVEQSGSSPGS
jgi:PAP2 superfamily